MMWIVSGLSVLLIIHKHRFFFILGPVGVVRIVTRCGLDYPGIDLGRGRQFKQTSTQTLGRTSLLYSGEGVFPEVKVADEWR